MGYITKACGLGFPKSCLHAGMMDIKNPTINENERKYERGIQSLERACELKNKTACYYLSGMFMASNAVKQDLKRAFKYAERACELRKFFSCYLFFFTMYYRITNTDFFSLYIFMLKPQSNV